jgi:hypothetical protein
MKDVKFKAGQTVMITAFEGRSKLSIIVKLPKNLKFKDGLYSFCSKEIVGYAIDERDMVNVITKE